MNQKWQYSTHRVVLRIPKLVGQVWELDCRTELGPLEATSPEGFLERAGVWPYFLAKDEAGNYCLIEERCVPEIECIPKKEKIEYINSPYTDDIIKKEFFIKNKEQRKNYKEC